MKFAELDRRAHITDIQVTDLDMGSPELRKAMALLGLTGLGERR
ncbi:hypothetical protein [Arthrobacter sp. NPDC089319]